MGWLIDRLKARWRRELIPGAQVCALLANIHRDSKKKSEPFTPSDFLPPEDDSVEQERKEPPIPAEVLTWVMQCGRFETN